MSEKLWDFLGDRNNVFTNVTVPKDSQPFLFERSYLYKVLNKLTEWPHFDRYNYFLLDSRRSHNFTFDQRSVVFYLSNEDHKVPDSLKSSLAVFTSYYPRTNHTGNVYSIPLGVNGSVPLLPVLPYNERKIDVFYSGNLHKRRVKFYIFVSLFKLRNRLNKILGGTSLNNYIRFTRRFASGLSPEEYAKMLSNTKIALAPEGYDSNISFRFFEAARAGCIVISCRQTDAWHYQNFPGFYVNSWAELPSIIKRLKRDPEKAEKIHQQMLRYYDTHCREESTARYIQQVLKMAG